MAQEEHQELQDAEKAEGMGASNQGAVLPASVEHSTTSNEAQHKNPDLELVATSSGPIYSTFSPQTKRYIVIMVTCAAFISPTSANIYFPALNPLSKEYNVSHALINLTLTSYMIFQGLAPTLIGDLADMAGRRPVYIIVFIIYIGANIGLALQNSYAALFILRCLQSTGSSGAIALGYGVVADISTSAERGSYIGWVGAGTMLGPAISPVIGGLLAQFLGWRSIFWFLVIIAGCFLVPYALTVPETSRNVVGNGSIPPQGWNMTFFEWHRFHKDSKSSKSSTTTNTESDSISNQALPQPPPHQTPKLRFPNPLSTLRIIIEKDISLILLSNALIYTTFYDIIATIPQLFQEIYAFNSLQIGLCYIPFGCGCALASIVNGHLLDHNYKRIAHSINFPISPTRGDDLRHFPIEKARLKIIWPILTFGLACILCYGWVLEKHTHLSIPLILHFLIGFFVNGSFNILSTLVVDLYPQSPATATAANNLVRCFLGAGGTAVVSWMIEGMGTGWCFTLLAGVCACAMPMLVVEERWGPGWREERRVMLEVEKERKEKEGNERENDEGMDGVVAGEEKRPENRVDSVEEEKRPREVEVNGAEVKEIG